MSNGLTMVSARSLEQPSSQVPQCARLLEQSLQCWCQHEDKLFLLSREMRFHFPFVGIMKVIGWECGTC